MTPKFHLNRDYLDTRHILATIQMVVRGEQQLHYLVTQFLVELGHHPDM